MWWKLLEELTLKDYRKEDEFILADINDDEYIDCNKDIIAITHIQTISDLILQYESENDINENSDNENLKDIMPSSAETIAS